MRKALAITYEITSGEMAGLVRNERDGRVRQRLLAIKFIIDGERGSVVAFRLDMGESTVRKWMHRFNKKGPEGLRDLPRPGQPPKITPELAEDFKERVCAGAQPGDGVCALRGPDFQRILAQEYDAKYSLSGTYFLLHRIGLSSLVPRQEHPQADEAAQEAFKKTFSRKR